MRFIAAEKSVSVENDKIPWLVAKTSREESKVRKNPRRRSRYV